MSRRIIVRGPGLRGPAGRDGLPGVNAVPADEAVAAYVGDDGSETRAAIGAAFVRPVYYSAPGQSRGGSGGMVIWTWTGADDAFVAPINVADGDLVVGPGGATPSEPETLFADDFERTPNFGISNDGLGTSSSGHAWLADNASGGGNRWAIDTGGIARRMTGAPITTIETSEADVTLSGVVGSVQSDSFVMFIIGAGEGSVPAYGVDNVKGFVVGRFNDGAFHAYNYDAGTVTNDVVVAGTLAEDDVLEVTRIGATAVLKKNGTTILTHTGVAATGTRHGLYGAGSGTNDSRWKSVEATTA